MTEKEKLTEILSRYFAIGDSYAYNLTRDKQAFMCGTMGFDDFEEFDEETVADIVDYLLANGASVPVCRVGDTVYAFYSTRKYTTIRGKKRQESKQIYTNHLFNLAAQEDSVEIREKKCTKGDLVLVNRLVFPSMAEAEDALETELAKYRKTEVVEERKKVQIVDIVKFNNGIGIVVDEMPPIVYEKHGIYLIGSDESGLLFDCLYYQYDRYAKAFGGTEFDLPMKDGTTTHCSGQYWSGRTSECSEILGIELGQVTIATQDMLKGCYVFTGKQINRAVYKKMVAEFLDQHPGYEVWGYWEYEGHLKGTDPSRNDHPDTEFQEKVRRWADED